MNIKSYESMAKRLGMYPYCYQNWECRNAKSKETYAAAMRLSLDDIKMAQLKGWNNLSDEYIEYQGVLVDKMCSYIESK